MRRLLPLLLAGLATPALAQGPAPLLEPPPPTRLEALAAEEGVVIMRGFSKIGEVKGQFDSSAAVAAQEFTNLSTGERRYGLTVDVHDGREERDQRSYVDYDEIGPLLRALEAVAKLDRAATQFDHFHADYRTHGELQVSTYSTDAAARVAASVTSGVVEPARALLTLADLDTLRTLIDAARAEIDKKRARPR
jgi:hypothetical protein